MLKIILLYKNIALKSWYYISLVYPMLLLVACTNHQKEDLFLEEMNRIVDAKSIHKSVPQNEHKKWISTQIDSLAKKYNNLNVKHIEQYKHFYNVKVDFLYEYYTDHDLEVISDKIAYLFKNYNSAYCSPDLQAHFYNELAHFYASIGLFEEAISYHEKMKQTNADLSFLLYQYKHLGNYYYQYQQYGKAVEAYKEKYQKQRKKSDIKNDMLAHMCNNIGLAYSKNKELDSALFYFDKAKTYWHIFPYKQEEKNYLKAIADGNKAEAYMKVGEYRKAIPLLQHEIKVTQVYSKSVNQYLTSTRLSLAKCYLNENQYKKAREQLFILQKIIQDQPYSRQKDYYEIAKNLAQKQQKVNDILGIDAKLDNINNLLYIEQNKQDEVEKALRLQTNNIQEQVAKKDKSIQLFKRNAFTGLGILIITIVVLGMFYRNRVKKLRKQNETIREEIQQLLATYKHTENKPVFTKREEEIIPLIIKKHTNKEISEHLFISVNTVKYHVKNIYHKLKVSSREEVISKLENGIK